MTKEEVLKDCRIEGNIIKLPQIQLDRKLYLEVANALNLIGGKWKGGKVAGFVFQLDPTELLSQISNGEKRNLKKEFQFFATPDGIADYLVELSKIEIHHSILEPSAGQGAIVKAINRVLPEKIIDCYELMDINQTILRKIPTVNFIGDDFLTANIECKYDTIIANPPFSKNFDIKHIRKMYDCLKSGGRIVSIASSHWEHSNNKKETEFKKWLTDLDAEIHKVEPGEFKESGTMVGANILLIDKP